MNLNIKLSLSFLLLGAGLVGFYVLSGQPVVLRILAVLFGLGLATAVFWTTPQGQRGDWLLE